MKRRPYARIIIGIFIAIYLLTMILATYLEKRKVDAEDAMYFDSIQDVLNVKLPQLSRKLSEESTLSDAEIRACITWELSTVNEWMESHHSQMISMAAYNETNEKVAQTEGVLSIFGRSPNYCFILDEYFSEEEIQFIQRVYLDHKEGEKGYYSLDEKTIQWYVHAYVNEETGELAKLLFTTEFDYKIDESDYDSPNTDTKWSWVNPDKHVHENLLKLGDSTHLSYNIFIPYLQLGEEVYGKWQNHAYLQDYADYWDEYDSGGEYVSSIKGNKTHYVEIYYLDGEYYTIRIKMVSSPWFEAINSLKYLYITSAGFIVACCWVVLKSLNKFYDRREKLEMTRRDFTNAIAHELKTPLGIIRGFAENSLENTNEAKREYYLKQIVGQTEEMDKLVKEMVYISKLDSEGVTLKKESVHLEDVMKSQLKKLETLSDEKNLDIKVNVDDDFTVQGDQAYLERAIWNVLHNAIEYNHLDGFIRITINKKELCIENSGVKLKEDEITHVFDMFYTNDKSRSFSEKHMGLGLYLTKRILELHKINITIGNTDVGVKVKIYM